MQIFVINVLGKSLTLEVDKYDFVEDLKEQIQAKSNIDPDLQKLTFCGKVLMDKKTLRHYNIQNDSNLHLSLQKTWSSNSGVRSSRLNTENDYDLDSRFISPRTHPGVFSSPEVNWDKLAKEAKMKVDKEIKCRKLQYDNILAVKIGTIAQANDLKREIEEDASEVKAAEAKVDEIDHEITCLMLDIAKLQEVIRINHFKISEKEDVKEALLMGKGDLLTRMCQKQSRLDMLHCDMANLDENMKRIIISDDEMLAKEREKLLKATAKEDLSMKDFLNESISAKKALLECPVCYEVASPPIHRCPKEHLICSKCLPRMNQKCPSCRTTIPENSYSIFRIAEEIWRELQNLILKKDTL